MADDIVQIIENARVDATSLSEFIYYPASVMVQRRLAPSIHTLNYYLAYLNGLELIYSQPTGTVTVNGEEIKTVRQAINDSIDSVILGEYQSQLETQLGDEVTRATNRENDIENSLGEEVNRATNAEGLLTTSLSALEASFSKDISDLSLVIDSQKLDTGITVTAKYDGVTRELSEKLSDKIHVKDLGLVGDGITDDSDKAKEAIEKGVPLDWGDVRDTYLFKKPVLATLTSNSVWNSNGAKILFSPDIHELVMMNIEANGYDFNLNGKLFFDADKQSNSGFIFNNTATTPSNFYANQLTVARCRRVSAATNGGDGIFIRGLLDKVILDNPDVRDISMATGAGVATRQGVFGITISRVGDTNAQPRSVVVNNPYIEDIYSDDPDYVSDQDGLRLFANFGRNNLVPNEFSAIVNGGTFKNCNGRAIKSQNEFTKVTGSHFIRTKGFARGYGNDEIDMQVGGGVVENITFSYDGSYASPIVSTHTPRGDQIAKSSGFTAINGVRGSINNIINPSAYVIVSAFVETDIKDVKLQIHNVEIMGNTSIGHLLIIKSVTGAITANVNADIQNITMPVKTAIVWDEMPNNVGSTYVLGSVTSTYSTACDVIKATNPQNIRLSTPNCFNLKTQKRITGLESLQSVTAVDAIVSSKRPNQSGMITPINLDLPVGVPVTIGDYGYFGGVFMLLFSIAQNANSQAILSVGGGGINLVTVASDVQVGATKPVSGTYKFWLSSNTLLVQNDSASARKFTGLVVG